MQIDWYAVWSHEIWLLSPAVVCLALIVGLDWLSQRSSGARNEQDVQDS